ncbi:MAG: hypothetical protein ACRDXX_17270 [Stackebrandtia sp.]
MSIRVRQTLNDEELNVIRGVVGVIDEVPPEKLARLDPGRVFAILTAAATATAGMRFPGKVDSEKVAEFVDEVRGLDLDHAEALDAAAVEAVADAAHGRPEQLGGFELDTLTATMKLMTKAIMLQRGVGPEELEKFCRSVVSLVDGLSPYD